MTTPRGATYRDALAARDFRWLLGGQALSLLGDEALRIALTVLVFDRSDSAAFAGLAYGLTYLPYLVGGPLLSGLADRMSRRRLMVTCDAARAAVVGVMAVPGLPLWALLALVVAATLLMPPFEAARSAIMPEMLTGDAYVVGSSLWTGLRTGMQALGFAAGGAFAAAYGARPVLAADALTFAVSAASLAMLGSAYLPGAAPATGPRGLLGDTLAGARYVAGEPRLRVMLLVAWWGAAVALVPEAVAAPYALRAGGGGAAYLGWYLAALPIGLAIGGNVIARLLPPADRTAVMVPLTVLTALPLALFLAHPPPAAAVLLVAATGAALGHQIPLQAAFVVTVPPPMRGRAAGIAGTGLEAVQGLSAIVAGAAAAAFGPAAGIGWAGIVGVVVMVPLALRLARTLYPQRGALAPTAT